MTESGEHFLRACEQLPLGAIGRSAAAIVALYVQSHTNGAIQDAEVAENGYLDAGTPAFVVPVGTNYELQAPAWPHHFRMFVAFGKKAQPSSELSALRYFSIGRTSPQFALQPNQFSPILTYTGISGPSQWTNDSYKFDDHYRKAPTLYAELQKCDIVFEVSRNPALRWIVRNRETGAFQFVVNLLSRVDFDKKQYAKDNVGHQSLELPMPTFARGAPALPDQYSLADALLLCCCAITRIQGSPFAEVLRNPMARAALVSN